MQSMNSFKRQSKFINNQDITKKNKFQAARENWQLPSNPILGLTIDKKTEQNIQIQNVENYSNLKDLFNVQTQRIGQNQKQFQGIQGGAIQQKYNNVDQSDYLLLLRKRNAQRKQQNKAFKSQMPLNNTVESFAPQIKNQIQIPENNLIAKNVINQQKFANQTVSNDEFFSIFQNEKQQNKNCLKTIINQQNNNQNNENPINQPFFQTKQNTNQNYNKNQQNYNQNQELFQAPKQNEQFQDIQPIFKMNGQLGNQFGNQNEQQGGIQYLQNDEPKLRQQNYKTKQVQFEIEENLNQAQHFANNHQNNLKNNIQNNKQLLKTIDFQNPPINQQQQQYQQQQQHNEFFNKNFQQPQSYYDVNQIYQNPVQLENIEQQNKNLQKVSYQIDNINNIKENLQSQPIFQKQYYQQQKQHQENQNFAKIENQANNKEKFFMKNNFGNQRGDFQPFLQNTAGNLETKQKELLQLKNNIQNAEQFGPNFFQNNENFQKNQQLEKQLQKQQFYPEIQQSNLNGANNVNIANNVNGANSQNIQFKQMMQNNQINQNIEYFIKHRNIAADCLEGLNQKRIQRSQTARHFFSEDQQVPNNNNNYNNNNNNNQNAKYQKEQFKNTAQQQKQADEFLQGIQQFEENQNNQNSQYNLIKQRILNLNKSENFSQLNQNTGKSTFKDFVGQIFNTVKQRIDQKRDEHYQTQQKPQNDEKYQDRQLNFTNQVNQDNISNHLQGPRQQQNSEQFGNKQLQFNKQLNNQSEHLQLQAGGQQQQGKANDIYLKIHQNLKNQNAGANEFLQPPKNDPSNENNIYLKIHKNVQKQNIGDEGFQLFQKQNQPGNQTIKEGIQNNIKVKQERIPIKTYFEDPNLF